MSTGGLYRWQTRVNCLNHNTDCCKTGSVPHKNPHHWSIFYYIAWKLMSLGYAILCFHFVSNPFAHPFQSVLERNGCRIPHTSYIQFLEPSILHILVEYLCFPMHTHFQLLWHSLILHMQIVRCIFTNFIAVFDLNLDCRVLRAECFERFGTNTCTSRKNGSFLTRPIWHCHLSLVRNIIVCFKMVILTHIWHKVVFLYGFNET